MRAPARGAAAMREAWGWIALAVLSLGGLTALWNDEAVPRASYEAHATGYGPEPLGLLERAEAVELISGARRVRFERSPQGDWYLHPEHRDDRTRHHHTLQASDVERWREPLRLLGAMRLERRLGAPTREQMQAYGLVNPECTVLVFETERVLPARKIQVGALATDTFSRYVLVEPEGEVALIAAYHIAALMGQLAEESDESGLATYASCAT